MDTQKKPLPRDPHEMTKDPVLGAIAGPTNALLTAFWTLQGTKDRNLWLNAIIRDAEQLADAARAMLPPCGSEFAGHACTRPAGCVEFHEDGRTAMKWQVTP